MRMVRDAWLFAEEKHKGQVRKKSGIPYISHPLAVSYIVSAYKKSKHLEEILTAAVLHDVLEDSDATFDELSKRFSPLTASLVLELSNDADAIAKLGKLEYQKKKLKGISSYALVIKLADRLHNVSDSPTDKMLLDTLDLLDYIRKERKLTSTQDSLAQEIESICRETMERRGIRDEKGLSEKKETPKALLDFLSINSDGDEKEGALDKLRAAANADAAGGRIDEQVDWKSLPLSLPPIVISSFSTGRKGFLVSEGTCSPLELSVRIAGMSAKAATETLLEAGANPFAGGEKSTMMRLLNSDPASIRKSGLLQMARYLKRFAGSLSEGEREELLSAFNKLAGDVVGIVRTEAVAEAYRVVLSTIESVRLEETSNKEGPKKEKMRI